MRTRFVIPTDGSDGEPLPSPHFDSVAENSARPVRPITDSEETVVNHRQHAPVWPEEPQPYYGYPAPYAYAPQPMPNPQRARRSVLGTIAATVLVMGAVVFGLALGYVIANRGTFQASSEPITAAVAFRQRTPAPDPEFTMPPEVEPEDVDFEDPDGEITIPIEIPILGDEPEPSVRRPRTERGPNSTPESEPPAPRTDPNDGTARDNSGDLRERRVTTPDGAKNRRGNSNTGTSGGQTRRSRNGVLTRIREILEGKP